MRCRHFSQEPARIIAELRRRIDEDEFDEDEIWDKKNRLWGDIVNALQKAKVWRPRKKAKFTCDGCDKR